MNCPVWYCPVLLGQWHTQEQNVTIHISLFRRKQSQESVEVSIFANYDYGSAEPYPWGSYYSWWNLFHLQTQLTAIVSTYWSYTGA